MNLANNHALDFGESGQAETIAALKRAGLRFTGRPGEIAVVERGGTKVAFVGFAPYPWAQSLLDIEQAVELVQKADRKADLVVVTMHAGAEGSDQQHVRPGPEWFLGEPRGNVVAFSHAVVRAGADLVVGHGPHVLRGIEWYRGRVIAYSLGNFLGNGTLNVSGVSGQTAVLRATLRRDGSWAEGKLVPVQLTAGGLPRVDSEPGSALHGTPALAGGLRAQRHAHLAVGNAAAPRLAHRLATYDHSAVRAELPSGTVTFLFTDVEGSTRLLHELGADAYAEALAEHRRAIREACAGEAGVEVDTQGDAFFFAFPTAPGGLAAASAMTEALGAGRIRVRAGLHTGTPLLAEEGYVGDDVHRAARIAAAGHGGQVLVSSATATLGEVELTDLGEHRLKDLGAPERVYQLGEGTFPPLKSLYRTNLPVAVTSFLGRERELAEIATLLRDSVTLVTLTGSGGTGKTRLAIHAAAEAAESFPDGIWWVPLSSLRDTRLVTSAVALSLGVQEEPGRELFESVSAHLGGKRALLVLDNAEHLMPEVATHIAELRDISGPTLMVTSRERLQLQGEHVYSVPALGEHDGVELFLARTQAVGSDVEVSDAVAELCARLDNLPLAIELAAARTVLFSPEQLVERLAQRLDLLKAGKDVDPRQQTLRATIEWSYDLLEPEEQRLFRALSVFGGSCTLEAAEAVCEADPDTLQSLLDKSLVRRREEFGRPRLWMLETIRELAAEMLGALGEDAELRRAHAEYYLALAVSANLSADVEGEMQHRLVIPERDNIRAVLVWALETDERQLGVELVVVLENYWATASPEEGVEWAARLLDGFAAEDILVARALRVQGGMANMTGRLDVASELWQRALGIARSLGDAKQEAILLHRLASLAARQRDWPSVRSLAEASLAGHRRVGFAKGEAQALTSLAEVAIVDGDLEGALDLLRESHDLCDRTGFRWWQAGTLARMGVLYLELGRLEDAERSVRQALKLSSAMHDRNAMGFELSLLAQIAARSGDARRSGVLRGALEAEAARAPIGFWLHGATRIEPTLPEDDQPYAKGQEAGRAMQFPDAVAFALAP